MPSTVRWLAIQTSMPREISACAMSAWMSEKPMTRSGSSRAISSTFALVKADTFGFSRRARGGRTVKPEMPTMRRSSPSAYRTSVGSSVRQTMRSHVAAILPSDLEEGVRDLAQRAHADCVHQDLENVAIGDDRLAQPLEHRGRLGRVALPEIGEARELAL